MWPVWSERRGVRRWISAADPRGAADPEGAGLAMRGWVMAVEQVVAGRALGPEPEYENGPMDGGISPAGRLVIEQRWQRCYPTGRGHVFWNLTHAPVHS